ncbi:MAG: protease 4 [candidate division BRC1 bacterium ADurb.BinA364]|nr:MAG: protease 4 [candidate division BRC1 bacterium ADurb.BinA364]
MDKTAESRQLTAGQAEAAAKGRVWTGRQALKMGLVDELGGLSSAIADARAMSGLPSDRPFDVVIYPEERSLMDIMQRVLGGQAAPALPMSAAAAMEPLLPGIQVRMGTLLELARQPRPLALAPFWLKIW